MEWHILAVKLGKTVRELRTGRREPMRAWEWMLWRAFLLLEPNLFDKHDYYMAALTAEVARGHSKKNQKGTSLKDRLIKFIVKKVKRVVENNYEYDEEKTMRMYHDKRDIVRAPDGRIIPPHVVTQMKRSKGAWFRTSGLNRQGKVTEVAKKKAAQPLPKHIKRGRY